MGIRLLCLGGLIVTPNMAFLGTTGNRTVRTLLCHRGGSRQDSIENKDNLVSLRAKASPRNTVSPGSTTIWVLTVTTLGPGTEVHERADCTRIYDGMLQPLEVVFVSARRHGVGNDTS